MARKKITVEELREDFEKAREYFSESAYLMPMAGDESKCVMVTGGGDKAEVYSCSALKGHLDFLLTVVR